MRRVTPKGGGTAIRVTQVGLGIWGRGWMGVVGYNATFRAVKRTIREGLLGDLVSIKIGCRRDTRTLFAPDDFRYSMRHPYVLDMSIHHFDLLRAATGQDVRSVFARSWPVPDSPFVHHPAIAAVLHLDNGVPVFYEGDWATHEQETSWNGEWQIVGERGQLFWRGDTEDRGKGEVSLQRWGEEPRAVEQEDLEFVERMATLQALREAIEGGGRQRQESCRRALLRGVYRER